MDDQPACRFNSDLASSLLHLPVLDAVLFTVNNDDVGAIWLKPFWDVSVYKPFAFKGLARFIWAALVDRASALANKVARPAGEEWLAMRFAYQPPVTALGASVT